MNKRFQRSLTVAPTSSRIKPTTLTVPSPNDKSKDWRGQGEGRLSGEVKSKKSKVKTKFFIFTFYFLLFTFAMTNGCKPAIDPNSSRTDYIRILDIGSVVSAQLLNTAIQSPPIRIRQTPDGNLAIISTVRLPFRDTSHNCIQLTKISLAGQVLWTHIYQDSAANLVANDFTLSPNGEFLIAATRLVKLAEHAAVLKTNENGDSLWLKQYTTIYNNCLSSLIVPTSDGKYLLCGTYKDPKPPTSFADSAFAPFLLLIYPNGDTVSTIPVVELKYAFSSNAIIAATGGGFLMVGSNPSSTSEPMFYNIQSNSNTQLSGQTWPASNVITIHSIAAGNSNGFILFGDSSVNKSTAIQSQSAVIYGVPDDGIYLPAWMDFYGDHNSFTSGIHTLDGGYLAAGYSVTRSDTSVFVAKIDRTGKPLWSKTYPGVGDQATSVFQAPDGTYIVAGVTTSFGGRGGTNQAFIMRLNANGDYIN